MKCKSGDMAIVTKAPGNACGCLNCEMGRGLLGKIVRVIAADPDSVWSLDENVRVDVRTPLGNRKTVFVLGIADEFLTPLRPDALDDEAGEIDSLHHASRTLAGSYA